MRRGQDGQLFKLCGKLEDKVFTNFEDKFYIHILKPLQSIKQGDFKIRVANICIVHYHIMS